MATVSLERTFFRVDETDNSVEVCVLFRGLGIGENTVTITIFTQDGSAVGMSQFMAPCTCHMKLGEHVGQYSPYLYSGVGSIS